MGALKAKFFALAFSQEMPTGTIDNTNASFTLASAPVSAAALLLTQNGLVLNQTVDYTFSGNTITMTTAPAIGQTLLAYYVK